MSHRRWRRMFEHYRAIRKAAAKADEAFNALRADQQDYCHHLLKSRRGDLAKAVRTTKQNRP